MLRIILSLTICALVAGCATEARVNEYQACRVQGNEKFPVNSVPQNYTEIEYFQRQEGMTCTRIPSGFYNAGGMECEPNMRTYQRQVQKTRYIDANASSRNSWIEQCANQQCISKFGNSDCEVSKKYSSNSTPSSEKKTNFKQSENSAISSDKNFMFDLARACGIIGYRYSTQEMEQCVSDNRAEYLKGNSAIKNRFNELISSNRCVEAAVFFKHTSNDDKDFMRISRKKLESCKSKVVAQNDGFMEEIKVACRKSSEIFGPKTIEQCVNRNFSIYKMGLNSVEKRYAELISTNSCSEAEVFLKFWPDENKFKIFQARTQLKNCKK
jgi:hypothetical protein